MHGEHSLRKANKEHACTICGESIVRGFLYVFSRYWAPKYKSVYYTKLHIPDRTEHTHMSCFEMREHGVG